MAATHDELKPLFTAAMRGESGAAEAFTDRLHELWPPLVAEWETTARRACDEFGDSEYTDAVLSFPVVAMEVPGPTEGINWLRLMIGPPSVRQADPHEWVTTVAVEGEWYDLYAGTFGDGPIHLPPPPEWLAGDFERMANYVKMLSGLSDVVDEQLP